MNHKRAHELAGKLLETEVGREALSKHLGAQVVSKEEAQAKPIVALLIPCRENREPLTHDALNTMIEHSRADVTVFDASSFIGCSVVHWARNFLIANLIKSGRKWDYVLFMDDDIVPPPDALEKLLSHKKDIVGAICTKRDYPPVPNIRALDEFGDFREIYEWGDDGLIQVDAVGMGMVLISRNALEQVATVYFECEYEKRFLGMPEELAAKFKLERLKTFDTQTANGYWFRFLPHMKTGSSEYPEDLGFCLVAKVLCEIPIFVDTTVRPGHVGKYPFSVADFLPYRDKVMAKARAEGKVQENQEREIQ